LLCFYLYTELIKFGSSLRLSYFTVLMPVRLRINTNTGCEI
jgi:hypothetical protein